MNRHFSKKDQQTHEKMLNITNHQGNTNQNYNEISPYTCQSGYYQNRQIASVGEDMEKREHLCTVGGIVNWCSQWKTLCMFLKNLKIELPYDPVIPLLAIDLKKPKTLI